MNVSAFRRMTAVCPSESNPEGAEAAARTSDSRGSGVTRTAASTSASAAQAVGSTGDSVGSTALVASVQRFNRWARQDSSDLNTDDEGTSVRRLTPLERLNLDMCQDERYEQDACVLVMFVFNWIQCGSLPLFSVVM